MKRSRTTIIAATALALLLAGGSGAATRATKTIVVNTTVDAPDANPKDSMCKAKLAMLTKPGKSYCSLRAAIQTANFGLRGSYVIKLPAGSFHLTVPGKNEGKAAKGDLDVLQADVTLVGQGPAKTTIDAGGIDRVFDVSAFASLTAQSLRITGGAAEHARRHRRPRRPQAPERPPREQHRPAWGRRRLRRRHEVELTWSR